VRLLAAAAVALALVAGYEVQEHRRPPRGPLPALPTTGAAADLTALQLGSRPGPHSSLLRRIDSLLELLQADCPGDSRRTLQAYTVAAIRELGRSGIAVTPNVVLGGVAGIPEIGATHDCRRFFDRFVAAERQEDGGG
jgi:hypothetical protein